jgi:hypothetical protein
MPTKNLEFVVKAKAVKADLAKQEITFTFVADMNDENIATASELAYFVDKDAGDVEIKILPRQIKMFKGDS